MYKKKPFFITFEGIEGSGKSYQSKKLYKNIKKRRLPVILTREPGGTSGAEKIRKIILEDYFYPDSKIRFNKYTDTLLYLAARSEHIANKIKPAISKKKLLYVIDLLILHLPTKFMVRVSINVWLMLYTNIFWGALNLILPSY